MPNKTVQDLISKVASLQADVTSLTTQMTVHLAESKPIIETLAALKNDRKWFLLGMSFLAALGGIILAAVLAHK